MKKKILKLNKPPMIEAVLEFRFEKSDGLIHILPGLLKDFHNFQQLPLINIPSNVRQSDPNLQYAPLLKFELKNYVILLGDNVLGIACKFPYPGWNNFKLTVKEILEKLQETSAASSFIINRYSIKYIDFLGSISDINFGFNLGNFSDVNSVILKTEVSKDDFIHSVQIVSNATIIKDGINQNGAILDIDTIKLVGIDYNDFIEKLEKNLDDIHESNKNIFIDMMTSSSIAKMEPLYE
jgi:uncharacterized protein (TIGR04255 family)